GWSFVRIAWFTARPASPDLITLTVIPVRRGNESSSPFDVGKKSGGMSLMVTGCDPGAALAPPLDEPHAPTAAHSRAAVTNRVARRTFDRPLMRPPVHGDGRRAGPRFRARRWRATRATRCSRRASFPDRGLRRAGGS